MLVLASCCCILMFVSKHSYQSLFTALYLGRVTDESNICLKTDIEFKCIHWLADSINDYLELKLCATFYKPRLLVALLPTAEASNSYALYLLFTPSD